MSLFTVLAALCVVLQVLGAHSAVYYPAPPPLDLPIQSGYQQQQPYEDRDYKFAYAVNDEASYNQHSREESKYGNTVSGQYTVLEPSGQLRVVKYVADENGFRAQIEKQLNDYAAAPVAQLKPQYPTTYKH